MSEEILKALMQLFALIIKQDGGMLASEREYVVNFLEKQLSHDSVNEYLDQFDTNVGPLMEHETESENKAPSVKDSVKIFSICKKITRTLNQSQKVVVLMRLYELIGADKRITLQRMNIINTVAEVFKIVPEELKSIERYVMLDSDADPEDPAILIRKNPEQCIECDEEEDTDHNLIIVLHISSVDLYFIKHYSHNQLFLNGLPLAPGKIYTIVKGSSLRYTHGQPIYYSDISSHFLAKKSFGKISFVSEKLNYKFSSGHTGIDNISISEEQGNLIGIMGSSGTGKTTLLNLFSGILTPFSGSVRVNGISVHKEHEKLDGVIGFVPQDDLLIEDLSVFENLYFAACLCFKSKSKTELIGLVDKMLYSLGLFEKRDLKVGSPLNKIISGGQRKRLNIALELIREPSVLFLDEPTSGLSSRDSENVLDLLRELTFKGKLIFSVIHQPSSEIYKMFDRVVILDQGGEMVYYGNPVEALVHFKTLDSQINSNIGECPSCGNINPESIFNIIETEVVDEFGRYTGKRKTLPSEWAEKFKIQNPEVPFSEVSEPPPSNLERPGIFKQFKIFALRDIRSKLSNRQYILLTLLEAPVLGFILSYIIRYIADPSSNIYIFRENENIPIYIFMSLIVALFLGLITSAEEIFKDRKIRSREQFLNLGKGSYLFAKILILFGISAGQALFFIIIANPVLGIKGLTFQYWFTLFTISACANLIGLNISASFNSAINIYIVVPMLMIPMMVLSGAMFPFDKLNRSLGTVSKVPVIADIMPTKWAYEALMVTQAKDNEYDKLLFDINKQISISDFQSIYRLGDLEKALISTDQEYSNKTLSENNPASLPLIRNELEMLSTNGLISGFNYLDKLNPADFNHFIAESAFDYINQLKIKYIEIGNSASTRKNAFIYNGGEDLGDLYNDYHNDRLDDIVRKVMEKSKILKYKDRYVQNIDPIFLDPEGTDFPAFRAHFFAPSKISFGLRFNTYFFNMVIIWLMTLVMVVLLYFEVLHKIINSFSKK